MILWSYTSNTKFSGDLTLTLCETIKKLSLCVLALQNPILLMNYTCPSVSLYDDLFYYNVLWLHARQFFILSKRGQFYTEIVPFTHDRVTRVRIKRRVIESFENVITFTNQLKIKQQDF